MFRTVLWPVVFLAFAVAYAVLTPPGEAPDEMPHLQHVDFMLHERRIPHRLRDGVYQDHHPPLYYAAAAVALHVGQRLDPRATLELPGPYWLRVDLGEPALDRTKLDRGLEVIPEALRPELERKAALRERHFAITRGHVVIVRLLSVLLALATLVLVHRTVRLCVAADQAPVAGAALVFAALLPQFQFLGGMINCDVMAIFTGNLLLYGLVRGLVQGTLTRPGSAAAVGLALGLSLLAKMSAVAMVVPVLVAYAFAGRLAGRWQTGAALVLALVVAGAVGGWWYALNFARYGDPFMVAAQAATMGEQIHQPPLTRHYFAAYFHDTVRSFFGQLGPFTIPIADWSFYLYVALAGLALAGLAVRLWRRGKIPLAPGGGPALIVLAAGLLATWLVVFQGNLTFYSSQGRYLYPGLAAIAAAIGLGLTEALRPGRAMRVAGAALLLAMAVHVFWFRFLPEYYPLRARAQRPLVVRYENAGHPHLSRALVAGHPAAARGALGSSRSPDARTARGARVALHFEKLPPAEPLRVRLRFGEPLEGPEPWRLAAQALRLNGRVVAGALTVTPRPRELAFAVPGYPGARNEVDVELVPAPGTSHPATVSEVWVERFPVQPRGLAAPAQATREQPLALELTVENLDRAAPARCRLQAELAAAGKVFPLGLPVEIALSPGETRVVPLRAAVPTEVPPGRVHLRAGLVLEEEAPFVDTSPCAIRGSDPAALAAGIEAAPDAFGHYRLASTLVNLGDGAPEGARRLAARLPLPDAPAGRYRLVVDVSFEDAAAALAAALRQEGRMLATARRDAATLRPGSSSRTTVTLVCDWPGGPGEIVLDGEGALGVDRVRLTPQWVPDLNRIPFPHEPVLDIR